MSSYRSYLESRVDTRYSEYVFLRTLFAWLNPRRMETGDARYTYSTVQLLIARKRLVDALCLDSVLYLASPRCNGAIIASAKLDVEARKAVLRAMRVCRLDTAKPLNVDAVDETEDTDDMILRAPDGDANRVMERVAILTTDRRQRATTDATEEIAADEESELEDSDVEMESTANANDKRDVDSRTDVNDERRTTMTLDARDDDTEYMNAAVMAALSTHFQDVDSAEAENDVDGAVIAAVAGPPETTMTALRQPPRRQLLVSGIAGTGKDSLREDVRSDTELQRKSTERRKRDAVAKQVAFNRGLAREARRGNVNVVRTSSGRAAVAMFVTASRAGERTSARAKLIVPPRVRRHHSSAGGSATGR